jgi:predicted hydrocarbon binding protein
MTPLSPTLATDSLTIGRGTLRQLHQSLLRDAPDHAVNILQDAGFAAGEGIYRAFGSWLTDQAGIPSPQELDAARLSDMLSRFFQFTGWGTLAISPLGAALAIDSADWAEAEPGSAETAMCFFSAGMLADFLTRLSEEPVAVMEVECRSKGDVQCRFLSASPVTLNAVYEKITQGGTYGEALGA